MLLSLLKATMAERSVESLSLTMDTSQLYFSLPCRTPRCGMVVKGQISETPEHLVVLSEAVMPTALVAAVPADSMGAEVIVAPSATDVICVILAARFAKLIGSIEVRTTIKKLSGGKSAHQNEIVGDLGSGS